MFEEENVYLTARDRKITGGGYRCDRQKEGEVLLIRTLRNNNADINQDMYYKQTLAQHGLEKLHLCCHGGELRRLGGAGTPVQASAAIHVTDRQTNRWMDM